MVDAVTNAAVSGFQAAQTRVATAATNIANQDTPDYQPEQVSQTEAPGGDTQTVTQQVPLTEAQQEQQQTDQQVSASIAVYDAQASIIVLHVQKNLNKQLFDIQA